MKLSLLIERLKKDLNTYGDLDVFIYDVNEFMKLDDSMFRIEEAWSLLDCDLNEEIMDIDEDDIILYIGN